MSALQGEQALRRIADLALGCSEADQTEVAVAATRQSLTRFAANAIHQNVASADQTLTARVAFGKRIGIAGTNRLDEEGIRRVVEDAQAIARLAPEDPLFESLPAPDGPAPARAAIGESTLASDPEQRATMAGIICEAARARGLHASGSINAAASEVAVANSLGIWSYTPLTAARVVALAHGEGGSGHAEAHNLEIAAIDAEALAWIAIRKALAGRGAEAIEPGRYTVVLEPAAVADLVQFITLLGFGARAVREGTSFITGKLGEQVLGPSITLRDDGHDPAGLPRPFDTEGVPRRPLTLVRAGVAEAVAYDSYYAHLEGKTSTGHAITGRFTAGPVPINVFMQSGDATREDLIAGVERGILVTRFHYTRVVHPHSVTVTGMTRDGTFLIERGAIARPVKNLRFTQSYVQALNQVEAIGREAELHGDFVVPSVPALRIADFTFTGSTV